MVDTHGCKSKAIGFQVLLLGMMGAAMVTRDVKA
jgi:hypothetical protein